MMNTSESVVDLLRAFDVTIDGSAAQLIQALESIDREVRAHSPIAVVLQAFDSLAPAYLLIPGQARMEQITESRLLELVTVMYDRYEVDPEADLERWLLCLCDDAWNPVRDTVQVIDMALGFVAQAYQRRLAQAG